jgi:hypothetical protein
MCEICVFRLQARLICHDWVTPAARDARRSFAVKSDIRDAQTHVHKSGGRQPAVGTSNAIGRADFFVRRHARQPTLAR